MGVDSVSGGSPEWDDGVGFGGGESFCFMIKLFTLDVTK